ncbi:hypothetical protein CDD83_7597 [Cordyceps sp. RAO-2017]|nr:hypothetical protein CDD83_7597 [Cordyceps sp. RAO-2017]
MRYYLLAFILAFLFGSGLALPVQGSAAAQQGAELSADHTSFQDGPLNNNLLSQAKFAQEAEALALAAYGDDEKKGSFFERLGRFIPVAVGIFLNVARRAMKDTLPHIGGFLLGAHRNDNYGLVKD